MKRHIFTIYLLCFGSFAIADSCWDAQRDRGMAVDMQNWNMMLRAADNVIRSCGHTTGRDFGRIVADKVIANIKLYNYGAALKNIDQCLNNYPAYPVCLYWKAVIFRDGNLKNEFEAAKREAEAAATYFVRNKSQLLSQAFTNEDRLNIAADIDVAAAVLNNLRELTF